MARNVSEWIADWYASDYYSVSPTNDPTCPATGTDRVKRGQSYVDWSYYLRVAWRSSSAPDTDVFNAGGRCARDAP